MKSLKKLYLLLGILSVALQTSFAGSAMVSVQSIAPELLTFTTAELNHSANHPLLLSAPARHKIALEISAFELEEEEDDRDTELRKLFKDIFSVSVFIHGQEQAVLTGLDDLKPDTIFSQEGTSLFTLYEVYRI